MREYRKVFKGTGEGVIAVEVIGNLARLTLGICDAGSGDGTRPRLQDFRRDEVETMYWQYYDNEWWFVPEKPSAWDDERAVRICPPDGAEKYDCGGGRDDVQERPPVRISPPLPPT